ncbi:hypothetical protein [Oceanobacillus kapialis]|uniref:hypothetical protein n=1 Tax=Oceanobacillus kapialis TaxID=481353 RepID=UPI00384E363B
MDLLTWLIIGFIMIGFVVLASMKKGMERKLAFITANMDDEESPTKAKTIIWWVMGTTAWGIVSMGLIVWWFHNYSG